MLRNLFFLNQRRLVRFVGALLVTAFAVPSLPVCAEADQAAFEAIPWKQGPARGEMSQWAHIDVPEGFLFTGPEGTPQFLELTENPPDPDTVGVLLPTGETANWVVYFTYDDSGHVKDDDRDTIDADALLASLKAGTESGNEVRRARGWDSIHVVDWVVPPGYEASTNRLAWGTRLRSDSGTVSANYDVRILGRTGVMSVTLACQPDQVQALIPKLQELLNGFEFKAGQRYAEWRSGDKLAAYGLTGLIVGGAAVGATKLGLFAKLFAALAKAGKLIVVAVLALIGGIWKFLSGGRNKETDAG